MPDINYSHPDYLLSKEKIHHALSDATQSIFPLEKFHIELSVESSNDHIKNLTPPCLLLAEEQTQGKGRYGRQWNSPFAAGIYLSMHFKSSCFSSGLDGLSLAVGIMVARFLAKMNIQIGIKWPNDLVLPDNPQVKLGGILVEVCADSVIIGIGINYDNCNDNYNKDSNITSIMQLHNKDVLISRSMAAGLLINSLASGLTDFFTQGFSALYKEWNKYDALNGRTVAINSGSNNTSINRVEGVCAGVDESGALLLKQSRHGGVVHGVVHGVIHKVMSGSIEFI